MGLIDRLIREGAKAITKVATEAIETVGDEIVKGIDSLSEKVDGLGETPATIVEPAVTEASNVPEGYESLEDEDVDKKLRAVFAKEFPQYEIREQVSPTTLGGTGKFMPYDFGVYENGVPKLFIMVVYNNTCSQRLYRWSKEEAERAGVTMINFVYCFENRIDYIINRLHQYL